MLIIRFIHEKNFGSNLAKFQKQDEKLLPSLLKETSSSVWYSIYKVLMSGAKPPTPQASRLKGKEGDDGEWGDDSAGWPAAGEQARPDRVISSPEWDHF